MSTWIPMNSNKWFITLKERLLDMKAEEWFEQMRSTPSYDTEHIVTEEHFEIRCERNGNGFRSYSYPIKRANSLTNWMKKKGWEITNFRTYTHVGALFVWDRFAIKKEHYTISFEIQRGQKKTIFSVDESNVSASTLYELTGEIEKWMREQSPERLLLTFQDLRIECSSQLIRRFPFVKRKNPTLAMSSLYLIVYSKKVETRSWIKKHRLRTVKEIKHALHTESVPELIKKDIEQCFAKIRYLCRVHDSL